MHGAARIAAVYTRFEHCEEQVLCHDIRMTGLAFIDNFGGFIFGRGRRHIALHQSDQHFDFLSDCMNLVGWSSHGHWYW
jgi:hypothetical protein